MKMIRGLCFGATALVLLGAASGGCSSDSSGSSSGTTSSSGDGGKTSSSSSGTSGTTSSSGASSGTSGASSSGTSGASSSGTSGSSGASSGDAGQDSGAAPTCATYCSTIAAKCVGATDTQFMSANGCATVCAALPLGTAADTGGQDSVGCRTYHANNTPPATHCPHAGAFGDEVCGNHCDTFCEIDIAACGSGAGKPFADLAACKTACAGWARSATKVNAAQPTGGNTFDCRAWHLLKATDAAANLTAHCPHTAAVSVVCQ